MNYFKITKTQLAVLVIIKRLLVYATLGGALATLNKQLDPITSFTLLLVREGLGYFIQICKTGRLDDDENQ